MHGFTTVLNDCRRPWLGDFGPRGFRHRADGRLDFLNAKAAGLAFDFPQSDQHIRIIRVSLQNAFILQDGGGQLAQLHVGMGQPFGSRDQVPFASKLLVSFFENFQRLAVLWLRLSDDLKHLNRLRQLGFLTGC